MSKETKQVRTLQLGPEFGMVTTETEGTPTELVSSLITANGGLVARIGHQRADLGDVTAQFEARVRAIKASEAAKR